MPVIAGLRRLRQDKRYEMEASLGYRTIFKTAWTMQCEAVSKSQELEGVRKKSLSLVKAEEYSGNYFYLVDLVI